MQINATIINLLHVCHREMWLHAHGVRMEHTSEIVAEGKLIDETSYPTRAEKYTEIEIDGVKIDFYDAVKKVVHEVKKSGSTEEAHRAQVKYYLYKLEQKGISGATGIIEYPKLKQRVIVESLSESDRIEIGKWERQATNIIQQTQCPPVIQAKICKSCSYFDFCYATESE